MKTTTTKITRRTSPCTHDQKLRPQPRKNYCETKPRKPRAKKNPPPSQREITPELVYPPTPSTPDPNDLPFFSGGYSVPVKTEPHDLGLPREEHWHTIRAVTATPIRELRELKERIRLGLLYPQHNSPF